MECWWWLDSRFTWVWTGTWDWKGRLRAYGAGAWIWVQIFKSCCVGWSHPVLFSLLLSAGSIRGQKTVMSKCGNWAAQSQFLKSLVPHHWSLDWWVNKAGPWTQSFLFHHCWDSSPWTAWQSDPTQLHGPHHPWPFCRQRLGQTKHHALTQTTISSVLYRSLEPCIGAGWAAMYFRVYPWSPADLLRLKDRFIVANQGPSDVACQAKMDWAAQLLSHCSLN